MHRHLGNERKRKETERRASREDSDQTSSRAIIKWLRCCLQQLAHILLAVALPHTRVRLLTVESGLDKSMCDYKSFFLTAAF